MRTFRPSIFLSLAFPLCEFRCYLERADAERSAINFSLQEMKLFSCSESLLFMDKELRV